MANLETDRGTAPGDRFSKDGLYLSDDIHFLLFTKRVVRVAEAGRLRVGVEEAAEMIEAAGVGVVLTLISAGGGGHGLSLSKATRKAVLAAVTTSAAPEAETGQAGRGRVAGRAVALKAVLPEASAGFTPPERALLSEWLDRLARNPG